MPLEGPHHEVERWWWSGSFGTVQLTQATAPNTEQLHHRHNATPKTVSYNAHQLPIYSTFSIPQPQMYTLNKGVAGAGRPPSLLVVAKSGGALF